MTPTVFLVDDDDGLRDALAGLLTAREVPVRAFSSAEELLAGCGPDASGCLLLDLRLPGMSGIELQEALTARGIALPIVFLTAYGDVPTSVHAVKHGAMDFLEKPVTAESLLERVWAAFELDAKRRAELATVNSAQARLAALTPREREVMTLAVAGQASKEIARALGISHRTIDVYRARIMHKTGARTLLELAELARQTGVDSSG